MKRRILRTMFLCGACMALMAGSVPAEEAASEAADVESISEEAEEAVEEEIAERPTYTALDYVTLGEYKNLSVELEPISVTQEDIDAAVQDDIYYAAAYDEITEGTVGEGDIANIDYVGTLDGEEFDGGSYEGYDLTIGSGTFIEGFEEGLIGVAIGDTVDLNLTFPEDYSSEELAGREVVFTVTVNSVKRVPEEITDELAYTLSDGACETVEEYYEKLEADLTAQAEEDRESQITQELMTQLYNVCTVNDYPQDLVDYSVQEMTDYYEEYAEYYGMEFEDFLSTFMAMDADTFRTEAEEVVKESIAQELILVAIAENEEMTISDEEYEEGCANYAENLGFENVDEFKASYSESLIRTSLMMDMAMEFVEENAIITEAEAAEATTEAVTE